MYKNFVCITLVDGDGYLGLQSKAGVDPDGWEYGRGIDKASLAKCLRNRNKELIKRETATSGVLLRFRKIATLNPEKKNYVKYLSPYITGDDITKTNTINIRLINLKNRTQTNRHLRSIKRDKL